MPTEVIAHQRPASITQFELWLAAQREPDSGRWNIALDFQFDRPAHVEALRLALADVAARHPELRSSFAAIDGEVVQRIEDGVTIPLVVHTQPNPYDPDAADEWAEQLSGRPFALDVAPLVQAHLLNATDRSRLSLTMHHIVGDGWSIDVLGRDLTFAYEARLAGSGPALPRRSAASAGDAPCRTDPEVVSYWRELLHGEWQPLAPLVDRLRTGPVPGEAAHLDADVPERTLEGLREIAGDHGTTPAVTVLAAWSVLMHAWSAIDDGVIGMPFSGRTDPASEDEIGLYTRVLPVRTAPRPDQTFLDFVSSLGEQVLDSFEYSEVATNLVEGSGVYRVVYAHEPEPSLDTRRPGTLLTVREADNAKYDLALACEEGPHRMRLRVEFDTDVYYASTARALVDQMTRLLDAIVENPRASTRALVAGLAEAAATSESATSESATSESATSGAGSTDRTVTGMFIARALARPEAVAVEHGAEKITYGELHGRAERIARWMAGEGVRPGDIVALLLRPGIANIVLTVATTMAGAAYLPMDPAYPDAQIDLILADAKPALTVVDAVDRAEGWSAARNVRVVGDVLNAAPIDPARIELPIVDAAATLNVLYTSGSTGRPKGVVLPHRGLARLMGEPTFIDLDHHDAISHLSPLNFDGASYEIWGALTHGARLVILDKDVVLSTRTLRDAIRRYAISTVLVTTPLLNRIIEDCPETLQSLRRVYFGGELISVPHVVRALAWAAPGVLLHSYGPTENSFTSTWTRITEIDDRARTVSIGRCVPGTEAYVVFFGGLDPAPVGVPGELLLGGSGLADGYLGDRERTEAAFVADELNARPGERLYRTGDRVRWRADGQLEFVGRADNQVKIRSQRVELGDVEAALRAHPLIVATFVTTTRNQRGEKEIVAYVTASGPIATSALRGYLGEHLPSFAVPTHLVVLDALPLTDNGKIDRRRLPEPVAAAGAGPIGTGPIGTAPAGTGPMGTGQTGTGPIGTGQTGTAPSRTMPQPRSAPPQPALGDVTSRVRAVWSDLLGRADLVDTDNFYDVGGHSLLLVKLQDALQASAGISLSIVDLMRHTTISAQAAAGRPGASAPTTPSSGARPADPVSERPPAGEPIAIIGMACRLAGAPDLEAFWDNLVAGRDCLTGTAQIDGAQQAEDPQQIEAAAQAGGARRVFRYGRLDDPTGYDAELTGFAGIHPDRVDPQHGIFHECLWSAVENAGLRLADIGPRTSLYAGRSSQSSDRFDNGADQRVDEVIAHDSTFLATRFSYWHDLRGESIMVDSACSTSLVAVHLACESLRRGASDYALAGGVAIADPADGGYTYAPGQIYSGDGYCRPLDQRASGTVPGDGAGAVLLRRLSDAVRDGDPIWAVIRGSAVNNEGRHKVGYVAPSVDGQADVIRTALAAAGVSGADVGYVEPHGTGTRMGDTIEAIALTSALGPDGGPVTVGGVKGSIGHTDSAAGVAGLIKAALVVHHGFIPPTPNVGEPLPELTARTSRFALATTGRRWDANGRARVAGVSSFGVGGTNAHMIIEEFEEVAAHG